MSARHIARKSRLVQTLQIAGLGIMYCMGVVSMAEAAPPPLTIINTTDLSFGSFVIINNGQVTVTPSGMANYSNAFAVSGGMPTPATFTITGEANRDVTIVIPSGNLVESISGATATFSSFTATTSAAGPTPSNSMFDVTLPSTGTLTLSVGGNVAIARSSGSGTIAVTIPVTATYVN
jgi:Domain of unknown function (DUF4402)